MRFFLCSDDAIHQPSGWLWLSLVLVVGLLSVPSYPAPVINGICSYGSNQNKISARFENDHVIQAVSPDWPDDSFAIRILPRILKSSFHFPDSHPNDSRCSPSWIGLAYSADQLWIPWLTRGLPGPRFRNLFAQYLLNLLLFQSMDIQEPQVGNRSVFRLINFQLTQVKKVASQGLAIFTVGGRITERQGRKITLRIREL